MHLTQNAAVENKLLKNTRKIAIDLKITANSNSTLKITISTDKQSFTYESEFILEKANAQPLTQNDFTASFSKLIETNFVLNNLSLETDGVFIPKSLLNKSRRDMINYIENELLNAYKSPSVTFNSKLYNYIKSVKIYSNPQNLYIIDENYVNFESSKQYIFSPSVYCTKTLSQFEKLANHYNITLFLPTIMSGKDLEIIKTFLNNSTKKHSLYANNIGCLNFVNYGHKVIASPLLNIKNNYAIKCLNTLNISTICASIEADENFAKQNNLISFESGNFPLMTFAHCPVKTNKNTTCAKCEYSCNFNYVSNKNTYKITRRKINYCYFELTKKLTRKISGFKLINLID